MLAEETAVPKITGILLMPEQIATMLAGQPIEASMLVKQPQEMEPSGLAEQKTEGDLQTAIRQAIIKMAFAAIQIRPGQFEVMDKAGLQEHLDEALMRIQQEHN